MGSIVTNLAALNAQRNLSTNQLKLGSVLQQLSSGYRINSAADDAAGLGISENMTAQISGTNQAIRNAQDGISMAQTAEGAMDEIHNMLQRMRELAVQGANDTLDTPARTSIGTEMLQLRSEIDRIAGGTTFNGKSLLTGSLSGTLAGVSASDLVVNDVLTGATATVATAIDVTKAQAGTYTMTNPGTTILTMTGPTGQTQNLDMAAYAFGAAGTKVLNFDKLGVSITLTATAAQSAANLVTGLTAAANDTIVVTGGGSALMQVGANSTANDTMSITFGDVQATSVGGLNLNGAVLGGLDWTSAATIVGSNAGSQALITQLDGAITAMNTARANLGASQNRLQHTVASLSVSSENLTASNSRIKDADIASLSSRMASEQVLQQAGVSVLAQANSSSQAVLKLLQ
jgi:flagellin